MSKRQLLITLEALPLSLLFTFIFAGQVNAVDKGTLIQFGTLESFIYSFIKTVQYYSIPIMTLVLVFLGIKLVMSGDDTGSKDLIKSWMLKILIGGVIIYGASLLANAIKTAIEAGGV